MNDFLKGMFGTVWVIAVVSFAVAATVSDPRYWWMVTVLVTPAVGLFIVRLIMGGRGV